MRFKIIKALTDADLEEKMNRFFLDYCHMAIKKMDKVDEYTYNILFEGTKYSEIKHVSSSDC